MDADLNAALSEFLARAVVETVRTPLLVLDGELRIQTANPAFYRTFHMRPAETRGKLLYELGDGQWDLPALRRLLEDVLPLENVLEGYEVTAAFPTIGTRTMLLNARRLPEDAGQAPLMLLAMEDVTERRTFDAQIARYTEELKRSNQALQEFASIASHDLQEPLRKIVTFGDRLRAALGDDLNERAADSLTRMLGAAERMQHLIEGLLEYSRVTTRAQPFEPVHLVDVVGRVLTDLEVLVTRTGAHVECEDLPTVDADPLQMRQLFQNLLSNALKFRRDDVAPRIAVRSRLVDGDRVELSVSDNGIGFDEKYAGRIFRVFERLHAHDAYEGSGIGLALCRKIVERHGGSIAAAPNPEGGATFTVVLPVHQVREESP